MSNKQPDRLKNLYFTFIEQADHFALLSHSKLKRRRMKQDTEEQSPALPGKAHGEGWSPVRPDNPDLRISQVKVERQEDGTFIKLFRACLTPAAEQECQRKMKELQRKAKKLKRIAKRQAEEAEAKLAKTRVRLALLSLGKY